MKGPLRTCLYCSRDTRARDQVCSVCHGEDAEEMLAAEREFRERTAATGEEWDDDDFGFRESED